MSVKKSQSLLARSRRGPRRSGNPWNGTEALVTRRDLQGQREGEELSPDQKLTLEEALALYTVNGAAVLGVADTAGSIAAGKSTDLIVLNQDDFSIDPSELSETAVLKTMFEDRVVFEAGKQ